MMNTRKPVTKFAFLNNVPGEYSTAQVSESVIETVFFPDDASQPSIVIGRTIIPSMAAVMSDHIAAYDA